MRLLHDIWNWISQTVVPSHRDVLCEEYAEYQSRNAFADKFPPTLTASDGRLISKLITSTISYYVTERVMIKRQPHPSELGMDIYGNPVVNPYIADRLRNEAAVLRYLRATTTLPVPEVLDLQEANGLVYLKTSWIEGAIELARVPAERMEAAVTIVSSQLESEILPQLRKLRSHRMGSPDADLPIIPPERFWEWKENRQWPAIAGDYVFCHIDLDRQNILVDPDTYKIVAIIDWETAGFFPLEWELPFWKQSTKKEKFDLIEVAKENEKGFFSS
ncbi:Protein kinase-like domain [Cordyceps militaris CM01]|uniref:Protein kinase-like domain n=1 Tax=Cordyceps militaris (strain CM01) TaxID=983644 RepID=G3JFS5_CORMM|nr:Protein kinase-like domain [Cordyceps militaris CM01]EGX92308.1 Protein kinase-like domain [Cordyceps militaris CM01]